MHRVLLVVSFFIISLPTLAASSIDGIKIGDNLAAIEAQHLSMVVSNKISDGEMRKYKTKDGNDLSITIINNKVVYIEKDWSQDLKSNKTLFSGFVFGKTSLSDIRTKFGTNGFTYKSIVITKKGDNLITFNCYELNDNHPTVLALVTKTNIYRKHSETTIANHLKLDAIILAEPAFLDAIWGAEKYYDQSNKKVTP